MNQQDTHRLILAVSALWPTVPMRADVGPEMIRAWHLVLSDIALGDAELAVVNRSRSGDAFPPAPGAIVAEVARMRALVAGDGAPDADQAWAEVMDAVRRRGWYSGPPQWSHPAVASVVTALGWDELCHGDVMVVRAHFVRLYTPAVERTTRTQVLSDTMTALAAGPTLRLPSGDGERHTPVLP